MQRTNMYFPQEMIHKLKAVAQKEDKSVTDLVRDFVEIGLEKKVKPGASVLLSMAKNAKKSGRKDLAGKHDHYLYGKGRI